MQAPSYNIRLDEASDTNVQFQMKLAGVAVDITGDIFKCEVRLNPTTAVLATIPVTLTDAVNGSISLGFSDAATISLGAGTFVYDVFRDFGTEVEMVVRGALAVKARVTVV